jgi:hypothetical protein
VVDLSKEQATRVARTTTTKRSITLVSMFFSYSLEIEEAFHLQRTWSPQDFKEILDLPIYFSGATVNFSNWINTIILYNSPGRIAAVPQ